MNIFLIVIHVVASIALILIVLLQTGKGADMGAAFGGGGSQTLFGSTGASTFLSKATTVAAVIFMLTSLILAYVSTNKSGSSVMSDVPASTPATKPETKPNPTSEQAAPKQKPEQTNQAVPTPDNTTTNNTKTKPASNDQTATPKKAPAPSNSKPGSNGDSKK